MTNLCTKVTVRKRPIKNGQTSLYLDFYPPIRNPKTGRLSRREYLGLYIYPKSVIRISRCSMAVRNPSVFPILKGRIVESSATWPSTGCAYPSFSPDKPAWR